MGHYSLTINSLTINSLTINSLTTNHLITSSYQRPYRLLFALTPGQSKKSRSAYH